MQIIAEHMSCIVGAHELQEAVDKGYSDIYIFTAKGILRRMKLTHGRHIQLVVPEIPNMKIEVGEEVNFLPAGKIPYHLLEEIVEFFKQVMTVKKAEQEAMAHILWNKKDGYHIGIPTQVVSKASVRYDWDHIKQGDVMVLDIHSHNTMGAFFSGTDNADDRRTVCFSGVCGKIDEPTPAFVWRFNFFETKKECSITDIFDMPEKKIEVKPEWLAKVSTPAPWTSPVGSYRPGKGEYSPTGGRGVQERTNAGVRQSGGVVDLSLWEDYDRHMAMEEFTFGHEMSPHEVRPRIASTPASLSPKEQNAGGPVHWSIIPDEDDDVNSETDILSRVLQEVEDGYRRDAINAGPGRSVDEEAYIATEYGSKALEAAEQIDAYLPDLEGVDEVLTDIIVQAMELMSSRGQEKIQTHGL